MFKSLVKKFFGTVNERKITEFKKRVDAINALEEKYQKLSDSDLKKQTSILKQKLKKNNNNLDSILNDAFAVCREAAKRTLNMRHFDVQLMGGMTLNEGKICEMRTGEGKTLVSTLAAYLNALTEKGVHIVTVNDYLATRDSQWMGKIFEFLGLSVGCIHSGMPETARKKAYDSDITYGTNNEFGFDYLRDNLKLEKDELVQREPNFAIIDEVDSILIDEARTPLIISGPAEDSSELYIKINSLINDFSKDDYEIDEKLKSITMTDAGNEKAEEILRKAKLIDNDSSLYDIENMQAVHHLNQAMRAKHLFQPDVDYIVKDNQVIIIDEFTGRMMDGRRFSDGLHQALEAKENVSIQKENQTLASVTFQNYFRNYPKLSGMTGTAMTEAVEFSMIYNLDVVTIPTNKKETRIDHEDVIYKTEEAKLDAIIKQIKEANEKKQPVLVGTVSIEKSELIAKILKKNKIPHNVLNAKHHEKEASIIAQAGRAGAVTIATNMAGRGTDIMLGGNPEMLATENPKQDIKEIEKQVAQEKEAVKKAGGLFVIGTERHESRRIDNQLRGRSGRQGDPGETKFFLSLEDDLMRIFGSEKIKGFLEKLGFADDEAIFHPWITRALEKAQQKVEAQNFEMRKSLLKFDDVLNEQRQVVYAQRKDILNAKSVSGTIEDFITEINQNLIKSFIPEKSYIENWDLDGLDLELQNIYGLNFEIKKFAKKGDINEKEILQRISEYSSKVFELKNKKYGTEITSVLEKNILIITLDGLWKDHLHTMDHLKTGINLRAYGQKDPLVEYKNEAFMLFEVMMTDLMTNVVKRLAHAELSAESMLMLKENALLTNGSEQTQEIKENSSSAYEAERPEITVRKKAEQIDPNNPNTWGRIGRNESCPCGSGKKYKNCHGKL